METIKLANGVEMPVLGYGVFMVTPQECERCVSDALSVGYRLIDTAQAYYNEEGVGAAMAKSGIARDEIFLTTKVWISNAGEQKAAHGTWRAMEQAYRAGKVRAIGVSNFQKARFFDFAHYVDIKPMVNQLQCNALIQQRGIEPLLHDFGTRMMAWGPLGGQGVEGVVKSELLASMGEHHGKSAAQVALRWLTQRGIVAIPKSTHRERMEQNLDIFDFELTADEMHQIESLNQHDQGTINFADVQFVKHLIETYG